MYRPMITALLVFCSAFALDFVWTRYIAEVSAKRAHHAAAWSASMVPLAAFTVVSYTTHWWLVVPAVLGAYSSTWWAVRRDAMKDEAKTRDEVQAMLDPLPVGCRFCDDTPLRQNTEGKCLECGKYQWSEDGTDHQWPL